jgi:hypothetical protein
MCHFYFLQSDHPIVTPRGLVGEDQHFTGTYFGPEDGSGMFRKTMVSIYKFIWHYNS